MTPCCNGQPSVTCKQHGIKRFREGHIDSVIGCEVIPQIPSAYQKKIVRIPSNWKIREIGESLAAAPVINLARGCIPAEDLCHFDVNEMRRVQRFLRLREKASCHHFRCWRLKQEFQECRGVDDDHC